jgi:hypothetical protein
MFNLLTITTLKQITESVTLKQVQIIEQTVQNLASCNNPKESTLQDCSMIPVFRVMFCRNTATKNLMKDIKKILKDIKSIFIIFKINNLIFSPNY